MVCFLALAWITGPREDGLLRLQSPTEPSRLPVHAERLGLRLSEEGSRRLVGTVEGCRVEVEVTDGLPRSGCSGAARGSPARAAGCARCPPG